MNRFLFSILFLFVINARAQNNIEKALNNFVQDTELKSASIGFIVMEIGKSDAVASYNSNISIPTASTTKLFATSTALEILGPDYQCETKIYYDGSITEDGVLNGNIWIRGSGDPSLGSKYFNEEQNRLDFLNEWSDQIKKAGIQKISGKIIADGSQFGYEGAPDGWSWGDMGNYYGSNPSGIVICDNQIDLFFQTSKYNGGETKIVSTYPEIPGLTFRNEVTSSTSSSDNAYIYGAPFSFDRFVVGTLPMGKSQFKVKGSNPDPEKTLAILLHEHLMDNEIIVNGEAIAFREISSMTKSDYDNFNIIHTHKGEKLIDIIQYTNMNSVNLFAEQIVCLVGWKKYGDGSTSSGVKAMNHYWENKINTIGLFLEDGSGLSRTNGISPDHFCSLLQYMNTSKYAEQFYNSLPVSGESGTLKSLCKNQSGHGKIHAKSGTMNRIKSYAGYIESTSGKKFVFALIVNNHTCSSSAIKKKMEPLLNAITNY